MQLLILSQSVRIGTNGVSHRHGAKYYYSFIFCYVCRRVLKFPFQDPPDGTGKNQHLAQNGTDPNITTAKVVKHSTAIGPDVEVVVQKKARAPRKARVVPQPKWVSVPTNPTYEQIKDRFFVRFSSAFSLQRI